MGYIQKGRLFSKDTGEGFEASLILSSWCIILSSQVWKGQGGQGHTANNSHMVLLLEVPGLTTALDHPATGTWGVGELVVGKNTCVWVGVFPAFLR